MWNLKLAFRAILRLGSLTWVRRAVGFVRNLRLCWPFVQLLILPTRGQVEVSLACKWKLALCASGSQPCTQGEVGSVCNLRLGIAVRASCGRVVMCDSMLRSRACVHPEFFFLVQLDVSVVASRSWLSVQLEVGFLFTLALSCVRF